MVQQAMSLFDQNNLPGYDELVAMADKGQINLVSELWKLRRRCPKEMKPEQCSERIRAFLASKFAEPDNKKIIALYDKYLIYEKNMREYDFGKASLQERFNILKQKRREYLGDYNARLVFGLDEARVEYNQRMADFMKDAKDLSGDERVKQWNDMRKDVYGDYYNAVTAKEEKFNVYDIE